MPQLTARRPPLVSVVIRQQQQTAAQRTSQGSPQKMFPFVGRLLVKMVPSNPWKIAKRRPHWSLGMVCCCIFLSDGILNDRWHFDVMRWQRGWSRKSGCKCGGILVLDSWLLLAASLNLEGKIIHRSKQNLEEIACLGFRRIMLIHTYSHAFHWAFIGPRAVKSQTTLLWHSCQQSAWMVHSSLTQYIEKKCPEL